MSYRSLKESEALALVGDLSRQGYIAHAEYVEPNGWSTIVTGRREEQENRGERWNKALGYNPLEVAENLNKRGRI